MFIKKKMGKMILSAAAMAVLGVSALTTGAYLTHSAPKVENLIEPGSLQAELTEPAWKEDLGENMLPGETRAKDPTVQNTGTCDAWVFLEVSVPMREIRLVDKSSKRKLPAAMTELVSFRADQSWELLEKQQENGCMRYLYGYPSVLAVQEKTPPLFSQITMANYLEGELDPGESLEIPIEVRAIQSTACREGTPLKEIYETYLKEQTEGRNTGI